jgi:hypothetical protein
VVESFDILDSISQNKNFKYLLESCCFEEGKDKNCLNVQMLIDSGNPVSNLSLIVKNNCNLIICLNYDTIFTLAMKISAAIFKESIDTSYYKEFGHAARKKIDEYIQLGVTFAVLLLF